jgi:hypothetical protein
MSRLRAPLLVFALAIPLATAQSAAQQQEGILGHFASNWSERSLGVADFSEALRLLRMDLDITGDGVAEVFLTTPEAWSRMYGFHWLVYELGPDTSFRYLGDVAFHHTSSRVIEPGAVHVMQPPGHGPFSLVRYAWDGSSIAATAVIAWDSEGDEPREVTDFRRTEAPPLAEAGLSGSGLSVWRDPLRQRVIRGLHPIGGEGPR